MIDRILDEMMLAIERTTLARMAAVGTLIDDEAPRTRFPTELAAKFAREDMLRPCNWITVPDGGQFKLVRIVI